MEVKLLDYSIKGEEMAQRACSKCIGKETFSEKSVESAVSQGHLSVLRHISMVFEINGVSRALTHQICRHPFLHISQESQRYVANKFTLGLANKCIDIIYSNHNDAYILELKKELDDYFTFDFDVTSDNYIERLRKNIHTLGHIMFNYVESVELGEKPEEARRILPNQTKTGLVLSCNAQAFITVCRERLCMQAQEEIRTLFEQMKECIKDVYPTVYSYCKPKCKTCTETRPCSRKADQRVKAEEIRR